MFITPRVSRLSLFLRRTYADLNRPSPFPLPRELQREFEELQRAAAMPLSQKNESQNAHDTQTHPDAPEPIRPEFEGEVNPVTGEKGGPKRERVRKWGDSTGDWSQKGRVSDF
jgi:hypothetical protein